MAQQWVETVNVFEPVPWQSSVGSLRRMVNHTNREFFKIHPAVMHTCRAANVVSGQGIAYHATAVCEMGGSRLTTPQIV